MYQYTGLSLVKWLNGMSAFLFYEITQRREKEALNNRSSNEYGHPCVEGASVK